MLWTSTYRPLVSVITPTYNQANFVPDCLDSVRNQTYLNWEQIIVDDGSEDATPNIVDRYVDSRTRFIRREHKGIEGLGDAYNTAFQMAHGELIAILEGDDCWPATKLEIQIPYFQNPDVVLTWGQGLRIDERGKIVGRLRGQVRGTKPLSFSPSELLRVMVWTNIIVPSSGVVLRAGAVQRAGGFYQPAGVPLVDMPTWLRIVTQMKPTEVFVYAGTPVAFWRVHPDQASSYEKMVVARKRILQDLRQQSRGENPSSWVPESRHLDAAVNYQDARVSLATGERGDCRASLRACWAGANLPINGRTLLATISYLACLDIFRLLPMEI